MSLVLELVILAAGLATGGPVADGIRVIGLIVAAMVGGMVVFVAGVFAVALVDQRKPPYGD